MSKVRRQAKGAVELLEEAVHLLRSAPFSLLACYYTGTLPFVLAFLYFWADMSSSPFARQHVAEAAAGVSMLYIWMKCWQSVFASGMKTLVSASTPQRYTLNRVLRLGITQTILQATGFIVLPFALIVFLPFAHAYAFYHNLSLIADGQEGDLKKIIQKAWRLASLWAPQNHALIMILTLFGFVIFLNWVLLLFIIPELIRMLFGIETPFTLSGLSLLNTTFLAVAVALTYLSVNPLIHTAYVLRCFWGESLQTGADLQAELKAVTAGDAQADASLRSA